LDISKAMVAAATSATAIDTGRQAELVDPRIQQPGSGQLKGTS
jgi:hypothetical protein